MFHKTRIRLVLLYSIVILLILTSFSALLYAYVRYKLFEQVDTGLQQTERKIVRLGFQDIHPELDIGTFYLFWNTQGELLNPLPKRFIPVEHQYGFRQELTERTMKNMTYNGQSYRLLQFPNEGKIKRPSDDPSVPVIAAVTLLKDLGDEKRMLKALRFVIFIGIAAGIVLSVIAGFFLAGRSLIPIRRSWDKQQQFVADASHELRTPTTVIQAQTELLFRHPGHTIEQESENIANVLKESKRMGKLIDDLLTLARSDSDQLQIQSNTFPLGPLLEDIAQQFRYLAETKSITINTDIQEGTVFRGDEGRIRQLIVILLDNSLKYTPADGTIELHCRKSSSAVHLVVKDSGCGIGQEHISRIFERFYRVNISRSRTEGGTGLGLSIAKWIVEAHDGDIRVQSELTKGTTFHITFPQKKQRE
ncbi:sensor histidine kinase [Paenibacillus oceani]|uniref:histidine kinase n=1 Tax=Paenibacillus oceani TaxID=2772510 RepID=A0A927C8H5_9BACL|nr:ATP-binding protein [Paenibacillus oceani]MBD2861967.1 sensor histidine kinase [Paenibacillus oceani]